MPGFKFFLRRFRWLRGSDQVHDEICEELSFHIDQRTQDNIRRGLEPSQARREAEQRFGHLTRIREEGYALRGGGWLESVFQDLAYGIRVLRRSPAFTLTAILTLALGIGVNTALFAVLKGVLIRPLPYGNADELFLIRERSSADSGALARVSGPDFDDIHDQSHSFTRVAALIPYFTYMLTGEGEPRNVKCTAITDDFFPALGIRPLMGRLYTPEEYHLDYGSAVISERFWRQQLGADAHVIGRLVTLQGNPTPVIGVMPDMPDFLPETDIWAKVVPELQFMHWRQNKFLSVVGRLRPGVTPRQAEQELTAILGRAPDQQPGLTAVLAPLKDEIVGKVSTQLKIGMSAVLLVLLITSVNVMCLLLARACERGPEVALRLSLGARPARILRQLVTENLVLAGLGSSLGIALAAGLIRLVKVFDLGNLPRTSAIRIDGSVLALALLTAVVLSVLLAWGPSSIFRRLNLNAILKTGRAAARRPRAIRALAMGEVACAIVLLAAAGLLLRSFRMVQQVDPGFQPSHLLSAYLRTHYQTPAEGAAFFNEVLDRLTHAPGLQNAAVGDCVPALGAAAASIEFDDRPNDPAKPAVADGCWISAAFFTTIGTNLEKGRFFTPHDSASAPPVVIVNKALAERYWPGENPLGKRIAVAYTGPGRRSTGINRFREVVGVVGDLKTRALDVPAGPALYLPFHQDETGHDYVGLHLFVRTLREPVWLADTVRAQIRGVNPNQTIDEMRTLDDVLYANLSQRRFSLGLLGSFAWLALMLAAVGIYGTIAFSLSQRTRELGVRIALGATPANLINMILKEGLALAGAGVVAGILLSALFTRAMASMLFRVKAVDPLTLIAVSLLLIAVAAAASFLPARKAAFANPLESLRAE